MLKAEEKKQIFYLIMAVIIAGVIFYLSSIPNLTSGLPSWQDLILRKIAHVVEYFILAYLLAKSLNSSRGLWLVIIVALVYAIFDELHQSFVPGREMTVRDILFDLLGVALAGIFFNKKTRQ